MIILVKELRWWRPSVHRDGTFLPLTQAEFDRITWQNLRVVGPSPEETVTLTTRSGSLNLSERFARVTDIHFDWLEPFIHAFIMGGFHERAGANSWLYRLSQEDLQTIFRCVFD